MRVLLTFVFVFATGATLECYKEVVRDNKVNESEHIENCTSDTDVPPVCVSAKGLYLPAAPPNAAITFKVRGCGPQKTMFGLVVDCTHKGCKPFTLTYGKDTIDARLCCCSESRCNIDRLAQTLICHKDERVNGVSRAQSKDKQHCASTTTSGFCINIKGHDLAGNPTELSECDVHKVCTSDICESSLHVGWLTKATIVGRRCCCKTDLCNDARSLPAPTVPGGPRCNLFEKERYGLTPVKHNCSTEFSFCFVTRNANDSRTPEDTTYAGCAQSPFCSEEGDVERNFTKRDGTKYKGLVRCCQGEYCNIPDFLTTTTQAPTTKNGSLIKIQEILILLMAVILEI